MKMTFGRRILPEHRRWTGGKVFYRYWAREFFWRTGKRRT